MSQNLRVVATSLLKSVAIGPKKLVMPSKYVRGKLFHLF